MLKIHKTINMALLAVLILIGAVYFWNIYSTEPLQSTPISTGESVSSSSAGSEAPAASSQTPPAKKQVPLTNEEKSIVAQREMLTEISQQSRPQLEVLRQESKQLLAEEQEAQKIIEELEAKIRGKSQ